jgi:hypothetical protein
MSDIYIGPFKNERRKAARKKKLGILLFLIAAVAMVLLLGIYGSFADMKGTFWEIAESFAWWALAAVIVGIWLYNNWYGSDIRDEDDMFEPGSTAYYTIGSGLRKFGR